MVTTFSSWRAVALPALLLTSAVLGAPATAAPRWTVVPARSRLSFSGTQTGTRFEGQFKRWNASIEFDPSHPEASRITVVVDLASAATGDSQRDTALPGVDWFDVAHFGQARFTTSSIRRTGANAYEARGALTIRGVTRQEALPFTVQVSGTAARAKGHLTLVRTAFGVGQGSWASGQWVALSVGVDFEISATRNG